MIQSSKGHNSVSARAVIAERDTRAQTAKGMRVFKTSLFNSRKASAPSEHPIQTMEVEDVYLRNSKYFNSLKSSESVKKLDQKSMSNANEVESIDYENL